MKSSLVILTTSQSFTHKHIQTQINFVIHSLGIFLHSKNTQSRLMIYHNIMTENVILVLLFSSEAWSLNDSKNNLESYLSKSSWRYWSLNECSNINLAQRWDGGVSLLYSKTMNAL